MATLISSATGNFTAAGTWKVASAVSGAELDSDTTALSMTTSNTDSGTFVLAATAVDGIAVKVSNVITPTGTFTAILRNFTTSTDVGTVTINCSDIRADGLGWHVFSFASHTPNGTDSYLIRMSKSVVDSGTNRIQIYASTLSAANMVRMVRTTTTGTPAANDKLIIAGEFTGAGASTPYTVTMNETATTSYGPTVSGGPPQGISVNNKATLTWATAAATNYYLKYKGLLKVYSGGTLNLGTSGTPIPSTSTAVLEMASVANVDTGLEAGPGSTVNLFGSPRFTPATITGMSNTTPIEITSTSHGLVAGERINIQGASSGAIQLTAASTEYLSATAPTLSLTTDFTVSVWLNPILLATGIFSDEGGFLAFRNADAIGQWIMEITYNGTLACRHWRVAGTDTTGTHLTEPGVVTAGAWNHCVFRWSAGTYTLWVNGTSRGFSDISSDSSWAGTNTFEIGRLYPAGGYYFNGLVDNAGIWSRALTDGEIASLYNSKKSYADLTTPEKVSLISFYNLNEISAGVSAVTRNDSHGSNHLTDNNTVPSSAGLPTVNEGAWEVIASTGANTFTIGTINGGATGGVGTSTSNGVYVSGSTWQRLPYTWLTADLAAAGTVCTVLSTAGMLAGDEVCFASTTRTNTQCEKRTILTVDSATQFTLSAGVTNAHSGTVPTRAEVGLLTRNVKVRGISDTLQGYIYAQTTGLFTVKDVEFSRLGSATANKQGIVIATTTGNCDIQYCALRDFIVASSAGFLTSGATANNFNWSNNVGYNIHSQHATTNAATSGTSWVISGNLFMLNVNGALAIIALLDVGGTVTNNITVGGLGVGLNLDEPSVIGTCTGNTAHSGASFGVRLGTVTGGTVTNTLSWRHNSTGLSSASGSAGPANTTINNFNVFGSLTQNITISAFNNVLFNGGSASGDSTFATAHGILINGTAINVTFENFIFGLVSGIRTAHTQDFHCVSHYNSGPIICRNCLLASPIEYLNPNFMILSSYFSSQKHDQTTNNNITYTRYGTFSTDTVIYKTTSPSMRMTPNNTVEKLTNRGILNGTLINVPLGQSKTIYCWVRKSVIGDGVAYNGSQPRLVLLRNSAIGINSDMVLATASGAAGVWQILSGVTPTATDDWYFEVVIDCDGSAGWINCSEISSS